MFLLWVAGTRADGAFRVPDSAVGWPLVTLVAWSALSLLWAHNRYEGATLWIHGAACVLVLPVAADAARDPRGRRSLVTALLAAGVLVSLLGLGQQLWGLAWIPQAFPPAATFGNRVVAAQFVLLTLPLGVGLVLAGPGRGAAAFLGAGATGLMGAYLLSTLTRSAWAGAVVETGFVLLWLRRSPGPQPRPGAPNGARLLALALAVTALLVLPSSLRHDVVERVLPSGPPSGPAPAAVASVAGRLATWRNTLQMIRAHPLLGVGLGNLPVYYPAYARSAAVDPLFSTRYQLDFAHNEYLQAWAELGTVGLGLVLWLGAAVGAEFGRAWRKRGDSASADAWTMAAGAGILGAMVDAALNFPLHCALPPLVLVSFLGILVAGDTQRELAFGTSTRGLGQLLVGGALAATAWWHVQWIRADLHIRRMHDAEARGDRPTVLSEASSARHANPHAPEPPFSMGVAYLAAGEPRLAAQAFEDVVTLRPYDLTALANLAFAYMQAQESAKALDRQRRAIALEPEEALFHFRAALLLEALGDAAGALGEHRLAASGEPTSRLYQYRWGLSALRNGSLPEAERALGRALALDPRSAATHKALGVLLVNGMGRRAEGVEHLRTALALEPAIQDHEQMRQLVEAYDKAEAAAPHHPSRP